MCVSGGWKIGVDIGRKWKEVDEGGVWGWNVTFGLPHMIVIITAKSVWDMFNEVREWGGRGKSEMERGVGGRWWRMNSDRETERQEKVLVGESSNDRI